MKRIRIALPLLLALLLCLSPLCAWANEALWSEEYYRAMDYSHQLSDAERESLDEDCLSFMSRCQADLIVIATTGSEYRSTTLAAWAQEVYTDCGFGYGPDHTGFVMAWDVDSNDVILLSMGRGSEIIPQSYLDFTAGAVAKYSEDYGVYGPLYATTKLLSDYVEEHPDGPPVPVTEEMDPATARVGADGELPFWYPQDPEHFVKYHDPDAPRLVDRADLIDDEHEAALEERLGEIRSELGRDMVVFTDLSTYGLQRSVYAADFYDFNGYGIGEDFEGVCLFVCMEPGNRGFWTCCTGPETMALYTETVANQIDDILYEYMAAGDYEAGLFDWVENFRRIYLTGSPYTPDWAMDYDESAPREHNPLVPRVVDDAHLLTEEELATLTERAETMAQTYQTDIVICTARSAGALTQQEYADRFYAYNGYGLGEDFDGILLSVFKAPGKDVGDVLVSLYGGTHLTQTNRRRLENRCDFLVDQQEYGKALSHWLDQTDHALKTGRAPRSLLSWSLSAVGSSLVGLVVAGFLLGRAKQTMKTPAIQERADGYVDWGRSQVTVVEDILRNTTSVTQYSPISKGDSDSKSSSSSHRSEYHSSYSGSSGTTHSGSGRSF